MNRLGWPTTDTTLVTRANYVLNQMNRDIAVQRPWRDLQRRSNIVLFTPVTTGNVTATLASTTLAGGTTSPTFSTNSVAAGMKVLVAGRDEVYTVSSVESETSLTLTVAWQGATTSNVNYKIWQDEYALATDFARPVSYTNLFDRLRVQPLGLREMRERYPAPLTPADPMFYTLLKPATGDQRVWRVLFYPPPDERQIIPYEYISSYMAYTSAGVGQETLSADADEPWMDERYRHILVWGALSEIYRDYKDDTRSGEARTIYVDMLKRMANDEEPTHDRPRLRPEGRMWAALRRRRTSLPYDIHNRFDRMES